MKRFRKTPKMFSKITSIFHAQSPSKHSQQQFIAHWKAVTNFFMENKDHHINVDQTTLPHHLDEMVQILVEEEKQCESGFTGPCLEYLLHHKALDTLYSLARSDCPPGMKQVVLQFFTKILSRIKQPILPHINVYKPVQRLVCLCGEVSASPAEQEEVQFISVLCAKLKADPYLVSFFVQSAKSTSSPIHSNSHQSDVSSNITDNGSHFKILEALLNLMASNDSWVSVKACEAMMLCASLPEPVSIKCILSSPVIECITSKLCTLYSKLPQVMEPAHIECIQAKWGWDFLCNAGDEVRFPGKRQMISFMAWLDYCDQLISISQPDIGKRLACSIEKHFLQGMLQPALLQTSEHGAITATSHLHQCVHLVSSSLLLSEFVYFILGHPSTDSQQEVHSEICDRLIERCNHLCDELSITTLKLFETLITKQHPYILDTLVLKYLATRSYVDFEKLQEQDFSMASYNNKQQESLSPLVSAHSVEVSDVTNQSSGAPSHLSALVDQSQANSSPITDQSEPNSSPITDQSQTNSLPATDSSQANSPLATDLSQASSPPATDQSQASSTPVTAQSQANSQPITDQSQTNSPLITDESQTNSSPVTDESQASSSPVTDESQTISSPVTDQSEASSSPVTDQSQGSSSPVTDQSQSSLSTTTNLGLQLSSVVINETPLQPCLETTNLSVTSAGESPVKTGPLAAESSMVKDQPLSKSSSIVDDQSDFAADNLPAMSVLDTELENQLHIHTVVNSFLRILDEDCQSSCQLDESGYETYLREAHRQFMIISAQCQSYDWPSQPVDNQQSDQFDEGPFLQVLLDRISHMLDQSYDINLHVTSLMSKLALMPHPHLNEYLLDPTLPVKSGYRTLFKLLEKIALVIKTRVKPIPDYHKKLIAVRKQLIGFSDSYRRRSLGEENQCLDNANALTGVIILEEFCKELAAIAFVKYHELAVQL